MKFCAENRHLRQAPKRYRQFTTTMKGRLLLILVLLSVHSFGQKKSIILDTKLIGDSLRTSGIDTFIVYHYYFIGGTRPITINRNSTKEEHHEKICEIADPIFILYKDKGETKIQKRNECYIFKTLNIDTSVAFLFYIKHFNELMNEQILTNAYINKRGAPENVYAEHRGVTELYLSFGTNKKEINIDWFDFSESSAVNTKNVNYEHNIKTLTKRLDSLISNKLYKQTFEKR